ncbi:MAG: iron transporter [Pseudomonadota bacterium]
MARVIENRRWHIASRVFAVILMGYLFANGVGLLVSLGLPLDRVTGVVVGTLLTFLIWGLVAMWAFWVDRTRTVWLGLIGGVIVSGGLAALFYFLENPS